MAGDYVSYMSPTTKDTRRNDWKGLNFAGSVDWAVDLQQFTSDDWSSIPEVPQSGEVCIYGEDTTLSSGTLCQFTCEFGFCPATLCECLATGEPKPLPEPYKTIIPRAKDRFDVELNRLCKFACSYGYCPLDICISTSGTQDGGGVHEGPVTVDPDTYEDRDDIHKANRMKCYVYQDFHYRDDMVAMCKVACQPQLDEAKAEGRTMNFGCVGIYPLDKPIPWTKDPRTGAMATEGKCNCDNWLVNELGDFFLDLMPMIAQVRIMATYPSTED